MAVLKVCCCRPASYCAQLLHCTALLTCKRECFKRRVHKQCSNGRNWHDRNMERHLQFLAPNSKLPHGSWNQRLIQPELFYFFLSLVSIGRPKASASVRPRPRCRQTVKSQPRSSSPDEVPDFDGAPHCGRTREMNDNLKRSSGSP